MSEQLKITDLNLHEDGLALTARLQLPADINFKQQLHTLKESGAHDLLDEFGPEQEQLWLERPVRLSGHPFLLRLAEGERRSDASFIELTLRPDDAADAPPGEAQMQEAVSHASRRFWWELDMAAVREALSVNEYGEELVSRFWPTRPANLPSAWEGLLKTVISVQIYPGLAVRLQQTLLDFYSDTKAHFGGREYKFYPSVARLAAVLPEDLLGGRFSRQKARYLPSIAQIILDAPQKFDWERLRSLPSAEAVKVLDDLPGVGPWIANYVAMRGLPHPDVFIDEAGLRKTLATAFDRRAEISSDELARLTAVYAPYRSLACYYTYMKMYSA